MNRLREYHLATALLHGLVAVFLIWRIDTDDLPTSWLLPVLPGLVLALGQMAAVGAGLVEQRAQMAVIPQLGDKTTGRWKSPVEGGAIAWECDFEALPLRHRAAPVFCLCQIGV